MTKNNDQKQVTQAGYDKLQKELQDLVENQKPAVLERLKVARAMGDLSENSAYTSAKQDLEFVEGRIDELEGLVKRMTVVSSFSKGSTVSVGSKVLVKKNGKEDAITIVGDYEADPMAKKISITSPTGKALSGKKAGDTVTVNAPAGNIDYTVVKVEQS